MSKEQEKEFRKPEHLYNCPAMRSLSSLTPGGSEFAGDYERCATYVKDKMLFMHNQIIACVKAKNAALERVDQLQAVLDKLRPRGRGMVV